MLSVAIVPRACAPDFPCASLGSIKATMQDSPSSAGTSTGTSILAPLLPAIASGNRDALATLYQRTSAKLYGIALHVLGDEGAAEEVLQDVFVTVWNKAAMFDAGRASPISWLAVMTRNRAIDRKRRAVLPTVPIEAAAGIPADAALASEVAERRQEAGRLARCLEELDERARGLIRDAFVDGSTYPQLAEREGVPLGTMKSWIRRGLQRLKGCLES